MNLGFLLGGSGSGGGLTTEVLNYLATNFYTKSQSDTTSNALQTDVNTRQTKTLSGPQVTNPRAARGGVAFDGTASTRVYSTLTNQAVGTDAVSLSEMVRIPTSVPSTAEGLISLSSSATDATGVGSAFIVSLLASGALRVQISNPTNTGGIYVDLTGVQSTYSGKTVLLTAVRSGATVSVYINAAAQTLPAYTTYGSSPGDFSQSITSTYLMVGYTFTTFVFRSTIYTASLYNLALTQADVTEIYELGGAVPERFKFGSQVAVNVSAMVNGIAGNNLYGTFSGASATGLSAADTTGFHGASVGDPLSISAGQRVRVKATLTLNSGTAPTVGIFTPGVAGMSTGDSILSAGANVIELTATQLNPAARISFYRSGATDFVLSAVAVQRLGAVVHFDGDSDGIGYQWHDQSTNKLDAVLTTTGVTWTNPKKRGYVRNTLTWAGTHENKSLLGQRDMPDGAVVTLITRKPTAASSGSGCTIGTTNSATRWQALAALSANTKAVATLANQLPAGTAAGDNDTIVDPDTANFTGSIAVEKHFTLTEGT